MRTMRAGDASGTVRRVAGSVSICGVTDRASGACPPSAAGTVSRRSRPACVSRSGPTPKASKRRRGGSNRTRSRAACPPHTRAGRRPCENRASAKQLPRALWISREAARRMGTVMVRSPSARQRQNSRTRVSRSSSCTMCCSGLYGAGSISQSGAPSSSLMRARSTSLSLIRLAR